MKWSFDCQYEEQHMQHHLQYDDNTDVSNVRPETDERCSECVLFSKKSQTDSNISIYDMKQYI